MTNRSSTFKKSRLGMAVGATLLGLSVSAQATDFGLAGGSFGIMPDGGGTDTATVSNQGIVEPVNNVPNADDLGVPTFGMSLNALNASNGTYSFQTYVVIDDNNSLRRFEASLGTFTLTVSGSTITGTFGAGQNIQFYGRNGANTFEVNGSSTSNVLQGVINLSGGNISFNAQAALDELDDNSNWAIIDDEFTSEDAGYTYALIFKAPAGVRLGNNPHGTEFNAYPCASTADLDSLFVSNLSVSGPAYVLQGQFATGAESVTAATNPSPFSAACSTSSGGGTGGGDTGGTTTPPPATGVDDVEAILDDIIIPGAGEEISEAVLANVGSAATAAAALGTQAASGIASGSVSTGQALTILTTIGNVVNIAGSASNASTDAAKSADTASKGAQTLKGFADVVSALGNTLTKQSLTSIQKESVQAAAVKSVVAGVTLLAKSTDPAVKTAVLKDLGKILSATINLGVAVTNEQAQAVRDAAESGAPAGGDLDDALENSVPFTPRPELISRADLSSALQGAGLDDDEADNILEQLSKAINPSDVNLGGTSAADALLSGLLSALAGTPGGSNYDGDTGTLTITIGGDSGNAEQLAKVSAQARDIPARAISSNVVSSTFPEGLRVRANGAVVITSDQLATTMVPAAYDSISFFADLARLGEVTTDEDGGIDIRSNAFPFNFNFSGTFDYRGVITGGAPVERTALTAPESGDESDLGYIYMVTYRDGTRQRMQPYIADNNFVASVRARGISVITNRNTGVVTVNGRQFRPSYFLDPLTVAASSFWQEKKDSFGIAFRPIDVNEDGVTDYEIITSAGIQVAYGVAPQ